MSGKWTPVGFPNRARSDIRLGLGLLLLVVACTEHAPPEVVVYTSVDQVFSEPVFREFERESGVRVRAVFDTEETKSTGVVNRLIAEARSSQADVFWSGDPVRPFLLLKRGLVTPYFSPEAAAIPSPFRSADGAWTGSGARARVLLVNRTRLGDRAEPRSIRDLVDPRWRGEVTMANPLFGTTTMHAAALFSSWGEDPARRFFAALRENEVEIASSNGEVKRLVVAGEVTFGLTDTDDAHQAVESGADVSVVYPDQDGLGTLIMPTAVVLLNGAPHPGEGRRLVDFLLSSRTERATAERAAYMPLRSDVTPPAGVRRVSDLRPMEVDYAVLGDVMERVQPWLRSWAGL